MKAYQLIEKGWTRGSYARDERMNVVAPESEKACYFCALGALVLTYKRGADLNSACEKLCAWLETNRPDVVEACGGPSIATWNDVFATQAQVLIAFKELDL